MGSWFHVQTKAKNDGGAALVMVLGIMMVGAVILTTLVLVTIYNTRYTAFNREELQTLASADAGIDIVLGQLEGKTYAELSTVCEPGSPYVINNDEVVVKFDYTVSRSGSTVADVTCPFIDDIVTSLTVTSTATAASNAATGEEIVRSVQATFAPTPPQVTLSKAIFSEASLLLTNQITVTESEAGAADANVYSNGSVTINTKVGVGGQVYASYGDIVIGNNAEINGTIWASGSAKLISGATVYGDVYAASPSTSDAVVLENGTTITGSVLTNGSILNQKGMVNGILFSRTSTITFKNDTTVEGSVYAAGTVDLDQGVVKADVLSLSGEVKSQNGAAVTGTVKAGDAIAKKVTSGAGVKLENQSGLTFPLGSAINPTGTTFAGGVGYPYLITSPQREPMPQLNMSTEDIAMWVASGWTVDATTECTGNDAGNFINDNPNGVTGPRLIVFDCSSGQPVQLEGANIHDIFITQDTALVSETGFQENNNIYFHGASTGENWTLYWIVPADTDLGNGNKVTWDLVDFGQYAPNCSAMSSGLGDIRFDSMKIEGLNWFVYTPCDFYLKNGTNFQGNSYPIIGQVYGGTVTIPTQTEINMNQIPIPSLSDGSANPTDPAEVRLTSRYDLRE